MSYLKRKWKQYVIYALLIMSFHLYFAFLMKEAQVSYLLYLDFLLIVFLCMIEGISCISFYSREKKKRALLERDNVVFYEMPDMDNADILKHDIQILEECLQEKFDENCELQDYVAKWCHEFKIPLAASLLMVEKIKEAQVRKELREQLERMNYQVSNMLQGCRLQSPLFDLQITKTSLKECVKESVRNNQFFLIQKRFSLDIEVDDVMVYTDKVWITYILDQLLNNAIKYTKEEEKETPSIRIRTKMSKKQIELLVEDFGEGIQECDIRRIFEKGFTGSNYHNGRYKSTGMGLYMVEKIAKRLGHQIYAESQYGKYTCFHILFEVSES